MLVRIGAALLSALLAASVEPGECLFQISQVLVLVSVSYPITLESSDRVLLAASYLVMVHELAKFNQKGDHFHLCLERRVPRSCCCSLSKTSLFALRLFDAGHEITLSRSQSLTSPVSVTRFWEPTFTVQLLQLRRLVAQPVGISAFPYEHLNEHLTRFRLS